MRVRHDKRKVLMGQDGLLDFYIEPYLLKAGHQAEIVKRLCRIILETPFAMNFREHLAARAQASVSHLFHAIQTISPM